VGDCPIRQRVICKKDFGLTALWGLNPEVIRSLWLIASATWGRNHFSWRHPSLGKVGRARFSIIPWNLLYNWVKARKTSVRVAEELETTRSADLADFLWTASAGLLNISPPRLPVGDFSQPLVSTGAFQVAELRGSPHQLTLSRNSQSVLWRGRRKMESPNPREFACF
jgi:hypothetical protein